MDESWDGARDSVRVRDEAAAIFSWATLLFSVGMREPTARSVWFPPERIRAGEVVAEEQEKWSMFFLSRHGYFFLRHFSLSPSDGRTLDGRVGPPF